MGWRDVDHWGQKTTRNKNDTDYKKHVMKMVHLVVGLFELSQLKGKPNVFVCMQRFDSMWLASYPHPREIGFENRGECIADFLNYVTICTFNSAHHPFGILSFMQS